MDTIKNVKKIMKYSLFLLIIFTFVHTYFSSMIQVEVELDSEIVDISNITDITESSLKLLKSEEDVKNISEVFSRRARHVGNICRYFKEDIPRVGAVDRVQNIMRKFKSSRGELYISNDTRMIQKVHLKSYLRDKKNKLLYCWSYKAASSFLMSVFYKASNNGSDLQANVQPWTLQNQMSPKSLEEFKEDVQEFRSVIVVRHPMVRLVSAYRDRIEGMKATARIYQRIAKVLKLERVDGYLKRKITKEVSGERKVERYVKVGVAVPTWTEFVRYLLSVDKLSYDPHWSLYTDHCAPCLTNFTFIVHMDTEGEMRRMLDLTGMSQYLDWQLDMLRNPTQGGSSADVVTDFMGELECDMVEDLYQIYWPDFLLFNFTMSFVLPPDSNCSLT